MVYFAYIKVYFSYLKVSGLIASIYLVYKFNKISLQVIMTQKQLEKEHRLSQDQIQEICQGLNRVLIKDLFSLETKLPSFFRKSSIQVDEAKKETVIKNYIKTKNKEI